MTIVSDGPAAHPRDVTARAAVRRLPRPREARGRVADVVALGAFVVAVTLGLWAAHGGISGLRSGGAGTWAGIGQLSGLAAALAALGGILLTSRLRPLERLIGQDRLLAAHRWFGIVTVVAVVIHGVADSWAWGAATGANPVSGLLDLLADEAWMVAALVAAVIMLVIALTSWRRLRRRIPYETWYFVHLTAYLAVLLGFGHQLTLGVDFMADPLAFWWWSGLFAITLGLVVWARLGDIVRAWSRPFYVAAVSREADGMGSLHVTGPGLRRLHVAGGQFFGVRALTPELWWQAHPFSVSAAPTTAGIRFTVKELGEDSARLLRVPTGTRLVLQGPYGRFTIDRAQGAPVVLVAGGAGIAPIRALLEDCSAEQRPVVIVRVREESQLAHRIELERLVAARGGRLQVLLGRREWFTRHDPFAPDALRAQIPDLAQRHVFVCGSASLESAVTTAMRRAGVPTRNIHRESFGA